MTNLQSLTTPSVPVLRPYQQQVIREVYQLIREGIKRILIVAPTGSGKTLISSQLAAHVASRKKRSLFVVHRDILISQTNTKFRAFNLSPGFIKSGWQEDRQALVQIASVQTLLQRNWWQEYQADVVMLDECHIVAFNSVVRKMMTEIFPNAVYIGLTATPFRLSKQEGMGDLFDALVSTPMPGDLVDQGFLVKPAYYGSQLPELEQVQTVAGDFDEGQLVIACDRPELIEQIVRDWQRLARGRRTIAFAVNVQHSQHLCAAFLAQGIPAAHVDGTTSIKAREKIYQQLAEGKILVLASCQALSEGFDVPSISAIILARPTQSKALYMQQVGRGLRLSSETNKRDCIVIDQSGNVIKHGYIEDFKVARLHYGEEGEDGEAPYKVCPLEDNGCGAIICAAFPKCPECSYVFALPKKLYYVPSLQQLLSESDFERYEFYRQKICEAYERKFAPGWAAVTFKDLYGHWPPDPWSFRAIFGEDSTADDRANYQDYLQAIAQRKEKPNSWVKRYMQLEFGTNI